MAAKETNAPRWSGNETQCQANNAGGAGTMDGMQSED